MWVISTRACPAEQRIEGFSKVSLKPARYATLRYHSFYFLDVKKKDWSAGPGEFSILVGTSRRHLPAGQVYVDQMSPPTLM